MSSCVLTTFIKRYDDDDDDDAVFVLNYTILYDAFKSAFLKITGRNVALVLKNWT